MKHRTKPAAAKRRKAYSYARFSDPNQSEGDSLRRQTAKARRYAEQHKLDLDETLHFRDLGVSAFRGKNAETGKLSEFIEAVRAGVIKQGSVLLVENFDRLSRLPPLDAVNLFNDILKMGVNVVLMDSFGGKEFSEDTLRDDPMALIGVMFMACHGNAEQTKKGERLSQTWEAKKKLAAKDAKPAGGKKTTIITAMAPCWLAPNGDKKSRTGWAIDKAKAKIVKSIFDLTLKGVGVNKIAQTFNEDGVPAISRLRKRRKDAAGPDMTGKWHVTFIQKLLANPAVIGEFHDHKREYDHKTRKYTRSSTGEVIKNYYPRIIEPAVFKKVAAQLASRKGTNAKGKSFGKTRARYGRISNMFAGLSRCPLCEATMTSVNKGNGSKVYLACSRAKLKAGCPYHAVRLSDVEDAFISAAWSGDFIRNVPTGNRDLDKQLEEATRDVEYYGVVLMETRDTWREQPSNFLAAEIRKLEKEEQEAMARWRELSAQAESADHTVLEKRAQELPDVLPAPFGILGKDGKETPAPVDKEAINAVLHRIFDHVVIDYRRGDLVIVWRNGAKTRIKYGKPLKREKAAA
jgi:DNA invertase Pin-like site-specific DNA recombinase